MIGEGEAHPFPEWRVGRGGPYVPGTDWVTATAQDLGKMSNCSAWGFLQAGLVPQEVPELAGSCPPRLREQTRPAGVVVLALAAEIPVIGCYIS